MSRKALPSTKVGRKSKYSPSTVKKIETTLIKTGSHDAAIKAVGVAASTYWAWRHRHPEFAEILTQALEKFHKLQVRDRLDLKEKAIDSLERLLTERKVTRKEKTTKSIKDKKTGHILDIVEVTESEKTYIRDPSFAAIEKVIGRKELEYLVLNKALKDGLADPQAPLFEQIFGKWGESVKHEKWGTNPFSDAIDLAKLRILQAETQQRFETGLSSFDEYQDAVISQSKAFHYIKSNMEDRSRKMFGKSSYAEILEEIDQFIQLYINTIEEVINDVGISRKQIPAEVTRRVKERVESRFKPE